MFTFLPLDLVATAALSLVYSETIVYFDEVTHNSVFEKSDRDCSIQNSHCFDG
jgi:hypothetical protein